MEGMNLGARSSFFINGNGSFPSVRSVVSAGNAPGLYGRRVLEEGAGSGFFNSSRQ